jgi:hypothetical protein
MIFIYNRHNGRHIASRSDGRIDNLSLKDIRPAEEAIRNSGGSNRVALDLLLYSFGS